jgi:exosortase
MAGMTMAPSAWGLLLLCLGVATQLGGGYYRLQSLEGLSVIPYIAGIALLVGGWNILRWAWPSIAFLGFMIPLPWRVETALGPPLQWMATEVSTYVLQTLGFTAYAEGFVIQVNDTRIGVVEACSGLSMVLTFIALSTAMAMVVRRPLFDKILLVLSSIPVSLAANVFRITLTGILHEGIGEHAASTFYHDLAGWIMIPLALFLYWLEIWVFSHTLVQTESQGPLVVGLEAQQHHLLRAQM